MCTLILLHQIVPAVPLVVLANRDEMLGRPSRPPALLRRHPSVFCGLDLKEGGTWCGINEHGVFVGLTNATLRPPDPARRSRGLLCVDMLLQPTAEDVRSKMLQLEHAHCNPFNLVVSDGRRAFRVRYDDEPRIEALPPGVHATTNWPVGSEGDAKVAWAEARVAEALRSSADFVSLTSALQAIARTHERGGDPRASICCHVPGYGTRSSSIIARTAQGQTVYVHSDGPPCETPYEDLQAQAAEALGEPRRRDG